MWRLTDTSAMPYGKYKGRPMSGVPADYLLWLHENGKCSESVARYIEEHKPAIEQRTHSLIFTDWNKCTAKSTYIRGCHNAAFFHLIIQHCKRCCRTRCSNTLQTDFFQNLSDTVSNRRSRCQ